MSKYDFKSDLPTCILCKLSFDCETRLPITQTCNHSVCSTCFTNQTVEPLNCPLDGTIFKNEATNLPLLILQCGPQAVRFDYKLINNETNSPTIARVKQFICLLANQVQNSPDSHSPQQTRKLLQLIVSYHDNRSGQLDCITKLVSIYERMLFEVIQVHYSTRSREIAVTRILEKKNCHIFNPKMTDDVIEILVKLFRAADDGYREQSFERTVLNKFLINKLGEQNKSVIEKIVQTLLWCNCFEVIKMDNAPSRFKLKPNIKSAFQMREQHDHEIIRKVRDDLGNPIRLSPESWASLLHGEVSPRLVANMQSLLDKNRLPVTIEEVESTMRGNRNNRLDLTKFDLRQLQKLQHYFGLQTELMSDKQVESLLCSILEEMASWFPLLAIRSLRRRWHEQIVSIFPLVVRIRMISANH